ncbi:MAG: DNA translocase FtsK [Patescibacteria group bacterium]|nr:DNA translocase FtsK [Patescibacteria group bacterium]MCL5257946.1 DNA translocase FtsK [Patescibacteria group bacterium]
MKNNKKSGKKQPPSKKQKFNANGKNGKNNFNETRLAVTDKIFNHYLTGEIIGWLFIFFGAFVALANYNKAGYFGLQISNHLIVFLGQTSLLFSLLCLFVGLSWLLKIKAFWKISNSVSATIIFLTLVGFSQIIFNNGGRLGRVIANTNYFFGNWGLIVLMLILDIVSLSIILEKPLFEAIAGLKKKKELIEPTPSEEATVKKSILSKLNLPKILPSLWQKNKKTAAKAIETKNNKDKVPTKEIKQKLPIKSIWKLPSIELLEKSESVAESGDIKTNIIIIVKTLANFGIPVEVAEITVGPTVTRYAIKPPDGIKISKISSLQNDLALALAAPSIRMETPIPGKSLIGLEVPNKKVAIVRLRPLVENKEFFAHNNLLSFPIGKTITGESFYADMAMMPHLLIAGTTGSGKSMFIHSILTSFLVKNTPETLNFILVDPKRVELIRYDDLPHLIMAPVLDVRKVVSVMQWLIREMENRYIIFQDNKVRDINSYNKLQIQTKGKILPRIILVIDEMADLMLSQGNVIEATIIRLTQMARATGIHLILATQRPSVDVVTGLIKANIPNRICFKVASQVDSRTVLDSIGAEKLLGAGDMLFMGYTFGAPKRLQAALITEKEINGVVDFWNKQKDVLGFEPPQVDLVEPAGPEFFGENNDDNDDLMPLAYKLVVETGRASTSFLQRKLKVGYARAARLLDLLEEKGVVGPAEGAKPRRILVQTETEKELFEAETNNDDEIE